jgi:8-oxo-dGTP pyrophosphatase MutT (NUDIX family)
MSSRTAARSKRVQYAALPYRPTGAAGTEVMLVTSRGRQRWIIPKGWPHIGRAPCDSAAREAFEEAGVLGLVGRRSLGSFRYKKRLKKGRVAVCDVHVFPLNVVRQRQQWPEKNQREIKWVSVKEAAATVQNGSWWICGPVSFGIPITNTRRSFGGSPICQTNLFMVGLFQVCPKTIVSSSACPEVRMT